jgi:hypothetical protein
MRSRDHGRPNVLVMVLFSREERIWLALGYIWRSLPAGEGVWRQVGRRRTVREVVMAEGH